MRGFEKREKLNKDIKELMLRLKRCDFSEYAIALLKNTTAQISEEAKADSTEFSRHKYSKYLEAFTQINDLIEKVKGDSLKSSMEASWGILYAIQTLHYIEQIRAGSGQMSPLPENKEYLVQTEFELKEPGYYYFVSEDIFSTNNMSHQRYAIYDGMAYEMVCHEVEFDKFFNQMQPAFNSDGSVFLRRSDYEDDSPMEVLHWQKNRNDWKLVWIKTPWMKASDLDSTANLSNDINLYGVIIDAVLHQAN